MRLARPSLGLLGQIFLIVLLTVAVEFGASTFLYERTSRLSAQEDEARRVAEHLVIARRMLADSPVAQRPAIAERLTTDRYDVQWRATRATPPPVPAELREMRLQIVAWEPVLARTDLRLRLKSPGRSNVVVGALRLPDGTWIDFSTDELLTGTTLAFTRIVIALLPALALIGIGFLVLRVTLRPMRMLANAADAIGHGAPTTLPEQGSREVRQVIHAFNDMQARILQLIDDRTEALAAVGHDLRTPIARLRLRTDAVRDPALRTAMDGDLAEMEAMLSSLLAFFGGDSDPEPAERIDLAVMLATLVDDALDRGRDAAYDGPDHFDAHLRPLEIKRAVANLVDNALHYGDAIVIGLVVAGDRILIRVDDDGPGIPPAELETVLRPFERLDPARARNTDGLGLGLAIVARAVARAGGTLVLANRPEGGLRAEIALPAG
ncbi:ATP-binding protein [Sphingomonas montana]|uniref:ATP-binding protein n=1 Tax=Sphingomonas montana TaxID=1843236 RepID=UPI00096E7D01|nr:ATP-binding protein [Sphingomonas montana]